MTVSATFYTCADSRFFIGAVALVNSLRLVGHRGRIVIIDCGLESWQRELLSPHVELVPAPPGQSPLHIRHEVVLRHPDDVMVLIDADMIAVRSMTDLIQRSHEHDQVIAFTDLLSSRFDHRWAEILGPDDVLRREPYVNAGLVFLPGTLGCAVLEMVRDAVARVDLGGGSTLLDYWRRDREGGPWPVMRDDHPFFYVDRMS